MGSHHEKYYFDDGNVVFLVDGILFKVHQLYFKRDSEIFRSMFDCPTPPDGEDGATDDKPIRLEQLSSKDFEGFLWAYYDYTTAVNQEPPYPLTNWVGAVRVAHRYGFKGIMERAMIELLQSKAPGVQIAAARAAGDATGAEKLLSWGFVQIAARGDGVTIAEAELIGLAEMVNVVRFCSDVWYKYGSRIQADKLDISSFRLDCILTKNMNGSGSGGASAWQNFEQSFMSCKDYCHTRQRLA